MSRLLLFLCFSLNLVGAIWWGLLGLYAAVVTPGGLLIGAMTWLGAAAQGVAAHAVHSVETGRIPREAIPKLRLGALGGLLVSAPAVPLIWAGTSGDHVAAGSGLMLLALLAPVTSTLVLLVSPRTPDVG